MPMNRQPLDSISICFSPRGRRHIPSARIRGYTIDLVAKPSGPLFVRFAPARSKPAPIDAPLTLRFVLHAPLLLMLASGLPARRRQLVWTELAPREPLLVSLAEPLLNNFSSDRPRSSLYVHSLALLFVTVLAETLPKARFHRKKSLRKAFRPIF